MIQISGYGKASLMLMGIAWAFQARFSNAAVKKICENVLLHLLQAMCGLGAGGAVRGNVTLRIAKQKTKQLLARKGKARKSMPVAI